MKKGACSLSLRLNFPQPLSTLAPKMKKVMKAFIGIGIVLIVVGLAGKTLTISSVASTTATISAESGVSPRKRGSDKRKSEKGRHLQVDRLYWRNTGDRVTHRSQNPREPLTRSQL